MPQPKQVCAAKPISKDKFQRLLSAAWSRVLVDRDQMQMATAMGERDTAAVKRGIAASNLPEAHKIFNSLCADPTALDEVLREYGFRLEPIDARPADDLGLAGDLTEVTGDLIRFHGRRSPRETCNLADKLRPIIAEEEAIVREADHLRGLN
jgi:hypothetical protein